MIVVGLDLGRQRSAAVTFDGAMRDHFLADNQNMVQHCRRYGPYSSGVLVIEKSESFGMPVGRDVFDRVFWAGRCAEAWSPSGPTLTRAFVALPRRTVQLHLCHTARATDATIRQALIDRFGPTKAAAVGTKAHPGPLHGFTGPEWRALALAVTWWDQTVTHDPIWWKDYLDANGEPA